jgi:hypothetical protein
MSKPKKSSRRRGVRHRLLQTKQARHRRQLYAALRKELNIFRRWMEGGARDYADYRFVRSRRKKTPRVVRQKASSKTVRVYLQVTLSKKINATRHKAKRRNTKFDHTYRQDIDRGNYKVRVYSEYIRVSKKDLESKNFSGRMRKRIEAYKSTFNKAKGFDRMNASLQLFTGRVLNPYTGLIGRPNSVTAHARMRSVRRKADTGDINETDFSFELTEFENKIEYMEELGFMNYGEEQADE